MTTTKVSVCNEALGMLGAKAIQSFDDSTENARRCASIYDSTRKALLRMHPWSFAKKRTQLAPISTHPTFGYANAFPLPNDFVRLYDAGAQDFEIEGRHILSDSNLVNLIYVFDNDNEQTWDTLFTESMALYLMHKLAKPITGSQSESDSAWQKLQNILKQARAVNAQERPSQDFDANFSPTLIGVRF